MNVNIKGFIQGKQMVLCVLAFVILLGSFLRLWQLGQVPVSVDWDEAALGYNAYSLAETGRDEFGKFLPVVLRSFDDYKPALYAYLIIPFYKIFGLNAFSVRLPSAILGILTIFSVFLLLKKLFARNDIALVTAFILAISPWHIQFSRVAFEANVGLALNVFAATFFVYAFRRPWLLLLSAFCAGLSIYAYQSEKVFTPLFMLGLVVIFSKQLLPLQKKYLIGFVLVGLITVLPMAFYLSSNDQALMRARGTSIFNDKTVVLKENAERNAYNIKTGNTIGKILDNRRIEYAKTIVGGYLTHYDPNWLIHGDIPRHHAPEMGLVYIWELPFILIGIYFLLFSNFDKRAKLLIFLWFLIAPIPASITTGVPHAVRTLNFLPTWQLFTALGLVSTYEYLLHRRSQRKISSVFIGVFLLIFVFNFVYYTNQYFVQQNYFSSKDWQYGWKEAVNYAWQSKDKFDKVVVSNQPPLDQSYIFFLYYLQYDPRKYQKMGGTESGGFRNKHKGIANIVFRPIDWEKDKLSRNTLFLGSPEELPINIEKTINYLNGEKAIVFSARY